MQIPSGPRASEVEETLIVSREEHRAWISTRVVYQGTTAVLMRNGRVKQHLDAGRRFLFRMPFQKLEVIVIDRKIRSHSIFSRGEFLTLDKWRVNVSLWFSYRVTNATLVALEYAEPVHALHSTVKDLLGQVIAQSDFLTLTETGRESVRQKITHRRHEVEQTLGMALIDVRVDELTLPERVGSAFDERQVAGIEGQAAQSRLRGQWQGMPDEVRRGYFQDRLMDQAIFVNPQLGSAAHAGSYGPAHAITVAEAAVRQPMNGYLEHHARPSSRTVNQPWGRLVFHNGTHRGAVFALDRTEVTIGRAGDSDLVLHDAAVSGRHARIERRGSHVVLTDQGSQNGTAVNGRPVREAQIRGGEVIRCGSTELRIELFR